MDDATAFINKLKVTEDLFYWVVRIKDEETPIGIVSFIKRKYLEHFDIGFAFLPQYWGKGYAYEATKNVLSIVRKYPEYSTILATTNPSNLRAIFLLKKLGLHFQKAIGGETLHLYST